MRGIRVRLVTDCPAHIILSSSLPSSQTKVMWGEHLLFGLMFKIRLFERTIIRIRKDQKEIL